MADSFDYTLIRSKRKSLSLQIKEDASLVVKAPRLLSKRRVEAFIRLKAEWILKQQRLRENQNKVLREVNAKRAKYTLKEYKEKALKKISERVEFYAQKEGYSYGKVRITSAKKRWGSCSATNDLNFTWRLFLAPDSVLDYVVVHELAHTIHKNHSKAFWNEVERVLPNWKKQRQWLRDKGFTLTMSPISPKQ